MRENTLPSDVKEQIVIQADGKGIIKDNTIHVKSEMMCMNWSAAHQCCKVWGDVSCINILSTGDKKKKDYNTTT